MKSLAMICLALATLAGINTAARAQACNVTKILDACAQSHGYNEDAACGLRVLGRSGLSPALAAKDKDDPGKTWDRAAMMKAAKEAAKSGRQQTGVGTALCCQSSDATVHACLKGNKPEVAKWLAR